MKKPNRGARQQEGKHPSKKEVIISKIFVGNLSFDATQSELEALFGEVGAVVEVFVPTDRDTGRPRGFAFVEFADEVSVAAAIDRFNDFEFQGRRLRVNEADEGRPRRPRFSEGGFDQGIPPKSWKGKSKGSRRNLRKRKRGF